MLRHRLPILLLGALVTIALHGVIVSLWHAPVSVTLTFATFTVGASFNAYVIAMTQGEVDGAPMGAILGRVLERSWAVLIVNFVFLYIEVYAFVLLTQGDILDRILSVPLMLIAASLIFAQTVAVTIDDERWWMLIPQAFGASSRVAWSGAMMWRALALFAIQVAPQFGDSALTGILTRAHVAQADFWANVPLDTIWAIPMNVLITLVFFDAIGYEPKRSCGE